MKETKSNSDTEKMSFEKALKLFFNTCEMKFNYWFDKEILPTYLVNGSESVTSSKIKKTLENFQTDVKVCLHSNIYETLLKNYFSSAKALDIHLKQYFYNKINLFEKSTNKNSASTKTLNSIQKGN